MIEGCWHGICRLMEEQMFYVNNIERSKRMSLFRVLLSIIFPPLAVLDKGCGSVLIVTLLTLAGWIPGVIGALVILNKDSREPVNNYPTYPTYPNYNSRTRCEF